MKLGCNAKWKCITEQLEGCKEMVNSGPNTLHKVKPWNNAWNNLGAR